MNLLAQSGDDTLTELIDLGASIRQAIARGDDQGMRELLQRRASALGATLARAKEMARSTDDSVSGAVADQIVQTLRAAMASDEAADEVRRGTLVEALDEPGFAALGVDPPTRPARRPAKEPSSRRAKGSGNGTTRQPTEADDLRKAEAEATRAADEAEERLATAADARVELERTRDDLVAQLAALEADLTEARATEETADRQYRQATATRATRPAPHGRAEDRERPADDTSPPANVRRRRHRHGRLGSPATLTEEFVP